MITEDYILWVEISKRIISLKPVEGFNKIVFKTEKLYRDALMNYMASGYHIK